MSEHEREPLPLPRDHENPIQDSLSLPRESTISSSQPSFSCECPEYLRVLIPTDENAGELVEKIRSTLIALRPGHETDLDALVQDIFLRAWTNQIPVTSRFIKHKLINYWESQRRYAETLSEIPFLPKKLLSSDPRSHHDLLNRVFARASLSSYEFMLVVNFFERGLSFSECSKEMRRSEHWVKTTFSSVIEKLRRAGRIIETEQLLSEDRI